MISIPESILFCSSFGGDGESMVFFKSRPLLLNSALSATNWRSGEPSRQSLAKCIFSDSLSPMLLKNTRDSPVSFQKKQSTPERNVCWTLITIITIWETDIPCVKVQHLSLPHVLCYIWERTGNFLSFFQKHWGKWVRRSDAYGDFGAKAFLSVNLVAVSG